jgi:hypothetical protein
MTKQAVSLRDPLREALPLRGMMADEMLKIAIDVSEKDWPLGGRVRAAGKAPSVW